MNKYNFPIGTVCFSNNADLAQNKSPGAWNHVILIINENQDLIEAQEHKGVIQTSWADYSARAYDWTTLRVLYPKTKDLGIKAAEAAKTFLGSHYALLASVRHHLKYRFNCVSLVSRAYSQASNIEISASIPDDLVKYPNIFTDKLEEIS